jgi:hypothetical protein
MKRWRVCHALIPVLTFVISLVGQGCTNPSVTNPYEFSDYTRLDIQNAFDVEIVQSGTYSISVTTNEDLKDFLSVIKNGDTVTIKLAPNHPFTDFVLMRKTLKARIAMPVLNSLVVSGASHCRVRGFESTNDLDFEVSGASHVTLNNIEAGDVKLVVSGESGISGKLTAVDVDFDVSGASQIELTGAGEDVGLKAEGASEVNLEFFVTQTADIILSGASQVTTDTRSHLDFSLSGASRLYFLANPNIGKMEVLGASTVKHK